MTAVAAYAAFLAEKVNFSRGNYAATVEARGAS